MSNPVGSELFISETRKCQFYITHIILFTKYHKGTPIQHSMVNDKFILLYINS